MVVITNLTRNTRLADRADVADHLPQRLVGLLSRASLAPGDALLFPRCNSIHTCFMRFPIDVVFVRSLDSGPHPGQRWPSLGIPPHERARGASQGYVVRVVEALGPFRLAWAGEADTVIELPAGMAAKTSTEAGARLHWSVR